MAIPKKFKTGMRVRKYSTQLTVNSMGLGGRTDHYWEITINKSGYRRLLRFVLAGGTRDYGKPTSLSGIAKFAAVRGGARAAARQVTAKQETQRGFVKRQLRRMTNTSDWQEKTVRIDGLAPQTSKELNEVARQGREFAAFEEADKKEEVQDLKKLLVQRAEELAQDPRYQEARRFLSVHRDLDEDEQIQFSGLTQVQKDRFLRAAAGRDAVMWENLLQSNVFDDASKRVMREFKGDHRLLLGMILMGVVDNAAAIVETYAPMGNPAFQG